MGISKAMMEKVFVAKSKTVSPAKLQSVVPDTERHGLPWLGNPICGTNKKWTTLTVTNPDMTRFLMSLDEAVELVIFAFKNAKLAILWCKRRHPLL